MIQLTHLTSENVEIFDHIKDFLDEISIVSFKKGEYLTRSDDNMEELFYVLEGQIKVECITETGKSILVDELPPQEFVGKFSYIYEQNLYCDIVAKSDATLIKIKKHTFKKLEKDPQFLKLFFLRTSKRIYFIYKKLLLKHLFRMEEIFAYHLLKHGSQGRFTFKSMYRLSDELSMSRKNLYNVVNRFIDKQYIQKTDNTIIIVNPKALFELSEGVRQVYNIDNCDFKLDV